MGDRDDDLVDRLDGFPNGLVACLRDWCSSLVQQFELAKSVEGNGLFGTSIWIEGSTLVQQAVIFVPKIIETCLFSYDWRKMVDATGIEPVTPSMSTRCSPAELRVQPGSGEEREAGIYRPGALKASGSGGEI